MTRFLLAGGGTAGHVNPLLSLADALMADDESNKVWALGTKEGLEANLVPARGYELLTVDRLPFPRKLSLYALRFPFKFRAAINQVKRYLKANQIDAVVGFGGYASAPAYLAAKALGVPFVVHEANALPGWANKLGAKSAKAVGIAFASTPLPNATFVGMPLRAEIEAIAEHADKEAARIHFGLDPDTATLLVTGGSLGAKRINETIEESRRVLSAAGIQVLHIMGGRSDLPEVHDKDYVRISYCDRMDLAIAASDFAVSRAGASTVCEFAAIGLPAAYVPYPVGNGEQKLNVADFVAAEGGVMVLDADFTPAYVANQLVPLVSNSRALAAMSAKAKKVGVADGTARLLELVKGVL
jgi:UDP-N-acetylglucosamine--N-acetylmuramyl-(pentapeptide) pyrophosphoryl-undecaprenol N-acetylglucosamine transferase